MSGLEGALAHARARKDEHLAEFRAFVQIPSISTLAAHQEDMHRAAAWLEGQLKALGLPDVRILPTQGHPVVYGASEPVPGAPTVLVYGHYDVQPVDPLNEWESDPFGAEIRGDYIYGRGVSDMKAQILAQIKAMDAVAAQGGIPVNLKYLIEGEEEIGSPHLGAFIEAHKDLLACDVVLNCDGGIHSKDVPAITYSLRGLAYFELEIETAKKDLHSGLFGGSVRNPLHVIAEVVAGLHDGSGKVTVPGFYDKVRPLDEEERELLARLPYSDEHWCEMAGVRALHGEAGYTTVERVGARPTLEANGLWGGFIGEGAKTVLPARAYAKISARLVPDQDARDVKGQLEAYLARVVPADVTWRLHEHSTGPGAVMSRDSIFMESARKSLAEVFGQEPLFKREGGSIPVVGLLQEALGVDSVMLGFELPDDGIHGPNERHYVPNYFRGIETYIRYLYHVAGSAQ